ncbi:hypothetical protein M5K25_022394 [Dendrobium thyrsiflorum]|uniref:Protein FAR1-RELATED SEQUENCE n=1 Tax=Dendrobium thyrsiflorum TaxID=117978 RepID=A0ABD0U618_DENTH
MPANGSNSGEVIRLGFRIYSPPSRHEKNLKEESLEMEISLDDFDSFVELEQTEDVKEEMVVRWGVYTSEKEAYEMYCDYGHNVGFSIQKEHHSYWPNSRKIKWKDFVCSRAGYKKGIDLNSKSKFRKFNTRTGCTTMIRFAGVDGMCIIHASTDSSIFFVKSTDICDQPHQWTIHFDAVEGTVECSCGKFSMMGIMCSHTMRVFRQLDIIKIPSHYLLLQWSVRARKDIYVGPTVSITGKNPSQSIEGGTSMIFRNHLSRFAYQISTRTQGNEDAEQYMLAAMVEMADNIDFILARKKKNQKFMGNKQLGCIRK